MDNDRVKKLVSDMDYAAFSAYWDLWRECYDNDTLTDEEIFDLFEQSSKFANEVTASLCAKLSIEQGV